uniref:Protein amnionless n=1 Tax=Strongyloides papillosus TaxID=174720 RepID=A0A0N5BS95_STREA
MFELVIERNSNLDDEYMKEICSFVKCEEDHEMDCWNPINVEGHCCKLCGQSIEFEIDKTNSVNQFMYIFGYTSDEYFVIRYKNGNVKITGTQDETKCLLSKEEGC